MVRFIFPGIFLLIAIFSLAFSKSKRRYQKVVEVHGERFAKQNVKVLKICGYGLIVCALLWSAIIFFKAR